MLLAAYACTRCDVRGRTPAPPGEPALCWCCGEPATITARVTPIPASRFRTLGPLRL